MKASSTATKFDSEGFDLDAAPQGEDVVLELGGGVGATTDATQSSSNHRTTNGKEEEDEEEPNNTASTTSSTPLSVAQRYKEQGNVAYKAKDYSKAHERYTCAIDATPGTMTGSQLLQLKQDWQNEQDQKWRQELAHTEEQRRKNRTSSTTSATSGTPNDTDADNADTEVSSSPPPQRPSFPVPHEKFPYASDLAVYYANRAAASLALEQPDDAIQDCTVAILIQPTYAKAWMRRATAYESVQKTDLALADAQMAQSLEPHNVSIRSTVNRLQVLEAQRLEQLKTETMDKLKDLGNSILSNFGLSLNNFSAVQDPNTGSYSINFTQK